MMVVVFSLIFFAFATAFIRFECALILELVGSTYLTLPIRRLGSNVECRFFSTSLYMI